MYLLNEETTIQWEILATASPPAYGDLDLLLIDPAGNVTYIDDAIAVPDYTPPTVSTPGSATYKITPSLEGLYKIRLVVGDSNSYQILSKVEMFVFDNTLVTSPYTDEIGRPAPYDINFYLQGYMVSSEIYGTFVASRTISLDLNAPASRALCEEAPEFFETTFLILYNGTQIGTIVFPIESYEGIITVSPQLISIGDKLQIKVGPGVVDDRIRDVAINLVGCCTVVPCTVL